MTVSSSPLVQRRRLRAALRQARQDAGLTQETVSEQMDWSLSKIIRIETGSVGISTNDLNALLSLYKVKDRQRIRELVSLGRASRKQTWWSKYRTVLPPTYFQYIEYETSATIILSYESLVVPGLLQTEEYATVIGRRYSAPRPEEVIKTFAEVRMRRQELLLGQPNPPLLFFILDEAVIRRLMGDESVRQGQLEKLISMANRPEVTIEVIPFSSGLHRGMAENFTILEFSESADDDILYFESIRDSIFSEATEEISSYRELFEDLRRASLGRKGTMGFLSEVADTIH